MDWAEMDRGLNSSRFAITKVDQFRHLPMAQAKALMYMRRLGALEFFHEGGNGRGKFLEYGMVAVFQHYLGKQL